MNLKQKWKDQEITLFLDMKGIIDEHVTANIAVLLWDRISLLCFQFHANKLPEKSYIACSVSVNTHQQVKS